MNPELATPLIGELSVLHDVNIDLGNVLVRTNLDLEPGFEVMPSSPDIYVGLDIGGDMCLIRENIPCNQLHTSLIFCVYLESL